MNMSELIVSDLKTCWHISLHEYCCMLLGMVSSHYKMSIRGDGMQNELLTLLEIFTSKELSVSCYKDSAFENT